MAHNMAVIGPSYTVAERTKAFFLLKGFLSFYSFVILVKKCQKTPF